MVRTQADPFDPAALLAGFINDAGDAGAIVAFTGVCRSQSCGEVVSRLVLDHYPGFTENRLERIERAARERFRATATTIIHRYGPIDAGDSIVFVAAAAEHRRSAFNTADYIMDQLKTNSPFWKKEIGPLGERWVDPRDDDYSSLFRWN